MRRFTLKKKVVPIIGADDNSESALLCEAEPAAVFQSPRVLLIPSTSAVPSPIVDRPLSDKPSPLVAPDASSTLYPSRRWRKRIRPWGRWVSISLLSMLLPVVGIKFCADSTFRNYFLGRIATIAGDPNKAIEYFDSVIETRKDPFFYEARAEAFAKVRPPRNENALSDLVSAVKLKSLNYSTYRRAILLAVELRRPELAADICLASAADPLAVTDTAALNLTLLGNEKDALQTLENGPDSSRHLVRVLIKREREKEERPQEVVVDKDLAGLGTLFGYTDSDEEMAALLRAFFRLDEGNPAGAREELKVNQNRYPRFAELVTCWTLYAEGNVGACLKMTDRFDFSHHETDDLVEANEEAAIRLLRKHLFMELSQPAKAAEEQVAYDRAGCSGKVFLPLPYRTWLDQGKERASKQPQTLPVETP